MKDSQSNSLEIGQLVEGEGIYLGTWEPKNTNGKSLQKIFNVFAAAKDLEPMLFSEAVSEVAALKNLHGHDGAFYSSDKELYSALENGSYKGEWFIPPVDLLGGMDSDFHEVQKDNLFAHKDTGAFKKTFTSAANRYTYWSCTEDDMRKKMPEDLIKSLELEDMIHFSVFSVHVPEGITMLKIKENLPCISRPMRAVEAPKAK